MYERKTTETTKLSDNYKNGNSNNNQHAISGNRVSYARALRPVEGILGHPRPSNVTISGQQQKKILSLKYARNTDLSPKKLVVWSINNNFVLQN